MQVSNKLRAFLARMLGWSDERAVELAMRSLALALDHRAALVLCGEGDLVPIAHALHRRTLGADRPFIVCDPRRGTRMASVRSPPSHASGVAAFEAAVGGSLCVRTRRLPDDFPALVERLRGADDVLCVICAGELADPRPPLVLPAPLAVLPLAGRAAELDRIIAEYAGDAISELAAPASSFTADDHAWVSQYAAASLTEIEAATLRLVALRTSRNMSHAAARLGMAPGVAVQVARPPQVTVDDALGPQERAMSRVILYRVGDKPRVTQLDADLGGGHAAALNGMLGGPVSCVPLHDGIQLCCNRGGLVFGLALARRALALSLAEPSRFEVTLRFENSELDLGPKEWPASGDFLMARVGTGGVLVDLTDDDIRLWMFWLGLDYILNR